MNYSLDACALIAYFKGEPGGKFVEGILLNREFEISIHAINLCEVYYDFKRSAGIAVAQNAINDAIGYGIEIREDIDPAFWKAAGDFKAELKKLSLTDAFALSLARRTDSTLVTSDHSEFDIIAERKLCKILFIR